MESKIFWLEDEKKIMEREYRMKCDIKALKGKVKIYSVVGICVCVCFWIYLAFNIFPK